ncbi:prephenate dehydratase [Acidobacterium sp. S8]|uniref:prephenate dehydratase n=1 Tax=Acidobacterium sp. S8 TaxID=1641854 RepID=UPI00131AC0B0|nr:prephenate dehydratase [Acidobacterium sp. S8]
MRVAIQGEPGSFSHEAAAKQFPEATIYPCTLSADVFRALNSKEVDAAVIPIENSLAGSVVEHYDLLLAHDVAVASETLLRIRHNLIAVPGTQLAELTRAYSHPVALAQCRRFFSEHPVIEAVPFYDTAGSAKHIIEQGDRKAAAIASERAAHYYSGEILAAGIEDNPENYTRFFQIRRRQDVLPDSRADKVSLAFTVENRPGTLVSALEVFASQGTNLTKIESRPVQGKPWQYVFYVDFQLSTQTQADKALDLLRQHCSMVKELGRYRSATQAE